MAQNETEQKSILIVEDDETLQQTLAYNLREEGYQVNVARDGYQGLEMARSHPHDLIVLDVMLPQLDGLSVCRILHRKQNALSICFRMVRHRNLICSIINRCCKQCMGKIFLLLFVWGSA